MKFADRAPLESRTKSPRLAADCSTATLRPKLDRSRWKQFCCLLSVLGMASFSARAASFDTAPSADAFVATGPSGNLSNNNYGGGGALSIAAAGLPNGAFQTVLRFDLSAARNAFDNQYGPGHWGVASVALQLASSPHSNAIYNDPAPGLFSASLMQNSTWQEGTGNASTPASNGITYNTLQNTFVSAADQPLGTFTFPGGTSGLNLYALDVPPQFSNDITAGANVSLRLFAADNAVSYLFSSRANTANQPELIITAIPEPSCLLLLGSGLGLQGLIMLTASGRIRCFRQLLENSKELS